MNLSDFLITPILILVILVLGWRLRNRFSNSLTRRYFLPALSFKIAGALILGLLYQFYYGGGDTFAFHTHGSKIIWQAFMHDPAEGLKLFFANGVHQGDIYKYSSQIWYFRDPQSYCVIRIAALFDFFTFGTYSGTAVLFALVAFSGAWVLFQTFYKRYPQLHLPLALSVFFVPSVVIWSSGILKDTLTMASIGWIVYTFDRTFIARKFSWKLILILSISIMTIYFIKIFILLVLIPALMIWYFLENLSAVKNVAVRILSFPLLMGICTLFIYLAVNNITRNDRRYSLDKISRTAQVTAYDIRYWTGKDAGSGYSLGALDGSFTSLLKSAPQGLVVSYFRPYLWEVRNPLMLLSSVEGMTIFILVVFVIIKSRGSGILKAMKKDSVVNFSLLFSIGFAVAVGVSTYNFGSLSRYKVPCIPFLLIALAIFHSYSKRERKTALVDWME